VKWLSFVKLFLWILSELKNEFLVVEFCTVWVITEKIIQFNISHNLATISLKSCKI
jgi:hypothetical protein